MSAEARRDVFQAISDPTRRAILGMLSTAPLNLNSIAEKFDISRPAISNHIKFLTQCGMVVVKQRGRERFCEAKLKTLSEVSAWVDQYRQFWTGQFDSLDKYLNKTKSKKNDRSIRKRA